jgi:hypothetical protein
MPQSAEFLRQQLNFFDDLVGNFSKWSAMLLSRNFNTFFFLVHLTQYRISNADPDADAGY